MPESDIDIRVLRELYRAPTGGVSRGELAILLFDVDDDEVTAALERHIAHGRVVDGWAAGIVRYYLVDAPATAAALRAREMPHTGANVEKRRDIDP